MKIPANNPAGVPLTGTYAPQGNRTPVSGSGRRKLPSGAKKPPAPDESVTLVRQGGFIRKMETEMEWQISPLKFSFFPAR